MGWQWGWVWFTWVWINMAGGGRCFAFFYTITSDIHSTLQGKASLLLFPNLGWDGRGFFFIKLYSNFFFSTGVFFVLSFRSWEWIGLYTDDYKISLACMMVGMIDGEV
ncbi:hypothetical protein L873DRAFT_1462439 [Choiromyces venosus 120613-1]|uniref:Uncharacterized protein n=1 Tax=Choiromyces venosus 120613-1 TaxID=1336337 RepID=A0A3N4K757_9PEZI|nr:hypothetical protein L873DRAFT_1462439 [Choiromyces venosus 120613-1]